MNDFKRKKILIVSDSHGMTENLRNVLSCENFDSLIFCGDGEGDEKELPLMAGCPAEISVVRGNNDNNFGLPFSAVISFGIHRIFVSHGHRYGLYNGFQRLVYAALEMECDICIFGHTHKPVFHQTENMILINPGSVSEPRQEGGIPTCAVLELTENGIEFHILNALNMNRLKSYSVMNN